MQFSEDASLILIFARNFEGFRLNHHLQKQAADYSGVE